MMLAGAFAATVGAWAIGEPIVGMLLALIGGGAVGLAVALVAVRFRADNMVTGLAVNIVALGFTSYLMRILASGGQPVSIHLVPLAPLPIPGLSNIPVVGPLLFTQPPLTYLTVPGCALIAAFLNRTQAGLTLRATGENPEAVFAAGGDPMRVRFIAVLACGAVAGLGGAVLTLQQVGTFNDGMTSGRGYLALAALIVGRWNPWGAAAACLVSVRPRHSNFDFKVSESRSAPTSFRWRPISSPWRFWPASASRRSCRPPSDSLFSATGRRMMIRGIAESAARLRRGEVTAEELLDESLSRIERLDPVLSSFVHIDEKGARAAARDSDARLKGGTARSPLEGVPLSVKDSLLVGGMPATWGSRSLAGHVPAGDELPVARLRAAGAVLVGKTNVP